MNTDTRHTTHRRRVAAVTLLAALIAVAHAMPAQAQGMPMQAPYGAQAPGQPMQQPGQAMPRQGGPQQAGGNSNGPALDQLSAWERRDMGVPASPALHDGGFHGPTPNQIPGGQVITTKGLAPLLQQGMAVHVFDVLGGPETLPNAIPAAWAAQPGSFDDATQQRLDQMLRQVTRGQSDAPLVFYCMSPDCWMSYNAALRAIRLGYRNVLWYRGGLEAWRNAGLPMGQGGGGMQGQAPAPRQRMGS